MINKKNGFTLVELLAVIVVLAIILVIAVPQIMKTIEESRIATFESTVKLIKTSAEKRFLENETLGITDEIKCEDIVSLSSEDYEWCEVSIDNGKSSVTLIGKGKFENLKEYGTISGYVENLFKADEKREENSLTNLDPDKNIRYSGSNPNNYVYYNCSDKDNNGVTYGRDNYDYKNSCEIWRIMGVFDVSNGEVTEKRVKIINTEPTFQASWDTSASDINSGRGISQWGESVYDDGNAYEGADIMQMLNRYYIGKSDKCLYCNEKGQETCENSCNSSVKQLSSVSLSMIEDAVWHTRAITETSILPLLDVYTEERETGTGKICSPTQTNVEGGLSCNDKVIRTTEWKGLVGLIYPSDYGYTSTDEDCASDTWGEESTCKSENWLHPLNYQISTISPRNYTAHSMMVIDPDRALYANNTNNRPYVLPTVYLKSSIEITGGNGASEEGTSGTGPYRLSL